MATRKTKPVPLADAIASLLTIGTGRDVEAHIAQRRALVEGRTVPELDAIASALVEFEGDASEKAQAGWLLTRLAQAEAAALKAAGKTDGPLPARPFMDAMTRRTAIMTSTKATTRKAAATRSTRQAVRYVCDGRVMPDNQNRISSVAYQYTRGIVKDDARIGSADLTKLLHKLGVTDPKASGWNVTLPNGVDPSALQAGIIEDPAHRLVVRDDTLAVLGNVSDSMALVYHATMGRILEAVLGQENVKFETAGSCRGGAQVWALAYLDEPFTVAGDDSETYPFIVLLNNHDGSGACKLISTSVRVVCWNTYQAASMQGERSGRQYEFRHVGDVEERIEQAIKALAGVRDDAKEWDELATELFGLKVTDPMVEDFLVQFLPEPVGEIASPIVHANVDRARKVFRSLYFDSPTCDAHIGTGLGLVDASVEYLDHVRGYRNRDTLMGRTLLRPEPLKAKAVQLVRQLVRSL